MIVGRSQAELERIYSSSQLVGEILWDLRQMIHPGINTLELDRYAENKILSRGAKPAFKGYRGYPATLCTSPNDGIVHGIPSAKVILREGDILSIDVGVQKDGYFGDAAITVAVGEISPELKELLRVTEAALFRGIDKARPGNRIGDVSAAVQQMAEANGFSVVKDYVGHGIGRSLHEEPQIPNYGKAGTGCSLREGMVLAIEPMVNTKGPDVRILKDKWTVLTADGGYSAHFEHTVAVTRDGPWIMSCWEPAKKDL